MLTNTELLQTLVVELLAHQFAFPVRWIETQEALMKDATYKQRLVEIGPAQVLGPMAKKTAARRFALSDQLRSTAREILSITVDADAILYNYPQQEATPPTKSTIQDPDPTSVPDQQKEPIQDAPLPTASTAPVSAASLVPDRPLKATDVLLALTAQKLKKSVDQLSSAKTLREISGGKSTLQNELVGDYTAEFGAIPDAPEDMPLTSLGAALDEKFSGSQGKHSSALVAKLISSKMPGAFNLATMKSHLKARWGLQEGRQIAVIVFALSLEPASRLHDEGAAKAWLNDIATRYATWEGIQLASPAADQASGASSDQAATIDNKSVELIRDEQRDALMQQYKTLAKLLGDDKSVQRRDLDELIKSQADIQNKLDLWISEFGDDFSQGLEPLFDILKIRNYDSWWNWARQDTVELLHHVATNELQHRARESDHLLSSIMNRLDASCLEVLSRAKDLLLRNGLGDSLQHALTQGSTDESYFRYERTSLAPQCIVAPSGEIQYSEIPRSQEHSYNEIVRTNKKGIPTIHLQSKGPEGWSYNASHTKTYFDILDAGIAQGLSFAGKTALVTGAGPKSIGAEVVKGLLQGGASVIVTTSRAVSGSAAFYQQMYQELGGRHSGLKVVPFNAASRQDTHALVDYLYSPASGFPELDFVVPFAAIPQVGQADDLSAKAELAHRAMLVNLLRLLGAIKKRKHADNRLQRPTNVILPLSPNHGNFGGDGLYGESKLGLETIFNRCKSEEWTEFLTVTGVTIGWTRGTGLMSGNNLTAPAIEREGVFTFSQEEMAFNILALMTPQVAALSEDVPLLADFSGGLSLLDQELKAIITAGRKELHSESKRVKALLDEDEHERAVLNGPASPKSGVPNAGPSLGRFQLAFPGLTSYQDMTTGTADLQGMPDLDRTVVVVGYSELGPWGNTRTRWDMESQGRLSDAGVLEMAWMMGLITHHKGNLNGQFYAGWLDAGSKQPVQESDFRKLYESTIVQHAGLRFIEPEGMGDNTDPAKRESMQEIVVQEDLPPFEASKDVAATFLHRHGHNLVDIEPITGTDDCKVHIKAGATFFVPKASGADRFVAGQLPKGWNAAHYGIPEDIISQVDPIVLYALCCLSEAVMMAGLQDPSELYRHIHVSELANCLGTGGGPLMAMRRMYKDRLLDRPVQNDILQETYLNAIGAWSNMLFLASSGPIRTPTGTCATAIESLDMGCESIRAGKAKVAIVGGSDDFEEEMSHEFGNMNATCNTRDELAKGRLPTEMSRPTTSSRSGFVESAGCGVQIITSASLALQMGLPIYGIVGSTNMAGDKVGRSVPAPGQGILTAAKEAPGASLSPFLDLDHRRQLLQNQLQAIDRSLSDQLKALPASESSEQLVSSAKQAAAALRQDARYHHCNDIRTLDANISPIRAALAAWGLTVNDIGVASFHGTSTVANEKNESNVVNTQMQHLGRTDGNPLLVIAQKYLTGHTKGAAAALMLNGALQVLETGTVPGNRNADNVDVALRQHTHLVFPSRTIQTPGVQAVMLTSFGFGQKGGLAVIVHPRHLYAAVDPATYEQYRTSVRERQKKAESRFARGIVGNCLFVPKTESPWKTAGETKVFLDPTARLSGSTAAPSPSFTFSSPNETDKEANKDTKESFPIQLPDLRPSSAIVPQFPALTSQQSGNVVSVGVDVESASSIPTSNSNFVSRNFTEAEQAYCASAHDPSASYAARWVGKEAVFKTLHTQSRGPGAAMAEIEIMNDDKTSAPMVKLHGEAGRVAKEKGIVDVQISLSHSDKEVMAVAVALR